jgi:hypothetical protein
MTTNQSKPQPAVDENLISFMKDQTGESALFIRIYLNAKNVFAKINDPGGLNEFLRGELGLGPMSLRLVRMREAEGEYRYRKTNEPVVANEVAK